MKIKTEDLTGAALDWAVAKAIQLPVYQYGEGWPGNHAVNEESLRRPIVTVDLAGRMLLEGPKTSENKEWAPSTDWAQSGPLVDKYLYCVPTYDSRFDSWFANEQTPAEYGKQTFLQALLRAIVKLGVGDKVDIPEGLV